ncbi:MAG: 30S ribosomal protein S12 methylthiotransferase RimO [Ruminococcaceae bacterium]|nr:30S ribosomal protein S12 methylthiotransferase RimO [Oscillospiraceae bacterium]
MSSEKIAVKNGCKSKDKVSIGMISLGCAKNRVDSEIMLGLLSGADYSITPDPAEAEVIIINTCGFIESAKQEAIDTILEMAEYKITGKCKKIIVTGCLSERYAKEIEEALPEVDDIIGVGGYDRICEAVLSDEKYIYIEKNYDIGYLNSARILTTPAGSAYLKIAEGCDNRCAYCAIPSIRGPFRSRSIEDIVAEAKRLADIGVKELVLVAQDTTRYGIDISADGRPMLGKLVRELNDIEKIKWIRLLYLYPDEMTEDVFAAMRECEKVLPYIDLPLQHIADDVLSRMNRRGSGELIRNTIKRLRRELPGCVIRTSLITGFPGETEDNHRELAEFLDEFKLDRVGIFTYSKEEGTEASKMRPQIKKSVKEQRYDELMSIQRIVSQQKNMSRISEICDVLVEGVAEDGLFYVGRSYAEAPEEDGNIYFTANDEINIGDIVKVKILIAEDYDLTGEQV